MRVSDRGRLLLVLLAGSAGSLVAALAGCRLLDRRPARWWLHDLLPGGHGAQLALLYGGLAVLCLAWLVAGWLVAQGDVRERGLLLCGLIWALPLALGPPLFSQDLVSYLAQGSIVHLGLDPYARGPAVLALHGQRALSQAVSPFWRHTPAPYGPAFLGLAALAATIAGGHLVLGLLLMRLPALVGVVLLAGFVPRLARRLGGDPRRALWLVVISPFTLVGLVASGHNDALMAGLLVAGVTLAVERRPVAAVAMCALAGMVKLPALLGVAFVVAAELRAPGRRAARAAMLGAVCVAVIGCVSVVTGLGVSWVSGGVFSTPSRVRLAITPGTQFGYVAAALLHALGIAAGERTLEGDGVRVAFALAVLGTLWLLWRVRRATLVRRLGAALLLLVAGGPASWPWYLIWGLALLACRPQAQRWRLLALVLVLVLPAFLIAPGGRLLLPRQTAPLVLALYVAAAVAYVWSARGGRPLTAPGGWPRRLPGVPAPRS